MLLHDHHVPRIRTAAAAVVLFSLMSCTTTVPVLRDRPSADTSTAVQYLKKLYPPGWEDVTGRSAVPSISLWLVNTDRAASMIVRTISVDENALMPLSGEDMCTLGHLSLRLKTEGWSSGRRITRAPERSGSDAGSEYCSYVYEENGLLRRVMVFRKGNSVFELELLQEAQEQDFLILTVDQNTVFNTITTVHD